MEKSNEEVGAEFLLEVIDTVDVDERAAFDAIRSFVEAVDEALPGGGKRGTPRRRVEIVEAGLKMIEQLLGVSNDVARRLTESVRQALPAIERNVNAAAKKTPTKRPAKKTTARKTPTKRPAKKTTARKTPTKRPAKKTPTKRPAKKTTARKTPTKRPAKKTTARKTPTKRPAKKTPTKRPAKKTPGKGS